MPGLYETLLAAPQQRQDSLWDGLIQAVRFARALPFPSVPPNQLGIRDADQILRNQDVGGGTGAHPNSPFTRDVMEQEMNQYISKRSEADI